MFKKILLLFLAVILAGVAEAQDSLSLQQCIAYALQNNTQLLRSSLNASQLDNSFDKTKASLLPTINGYANQNYNFGRTIDPSTNQFANQQNRTNYFSLNTDVLLFNGLQKINQVRQAKWEKEAGEQGLQKAKDDVSLTIASQYLQILLLEEKASQLRNQQAASKAFYDKAKILSEAGATTRAKLLEAEAQMANDEALLVDAENQLTKAYLTMKQYMNYDITKELKVQKINFQGQLQEYGPQDLSQALGNRVDQLPAVQQAHSSRESALYGLRAMQGNASPKINASASLHSVYSSLARNYGYTLGGYEPIGILSTDSSVVLAPKVQTTTTEIPFRDQLKNNYGQSLGFELSIPIFNGLQNRFSIQSAKIDLNTAELNLTDVKNTAKNDIYQAYEGMRMAKKKFEASETKLKAQESLFRQTDLMYQQGAAGYFDWNNQRTIYLNAQSDQLQAKYEYIFQTKIFEYYLGKPVQF